MTKKKKKSKKSKKKIKDISKLNKKLFVLLAIILVILVVIFTWDPRSSTNPIDTGEFSVSLSNCLVDLSARQVNCDMVKTGECDDDLVLLVEDNSDKTMVAIEGSPVPMGSVTLDDALVAQIVNIPGESGIQGVSECKNVLLVCGQEIFSSTCNFV